MPLVGATSRRARPGGPAARRAPGRLCRAGPRADWRGTGCAPGTPPPATPAPREGSRYPPSGRQRRPGRWKHRLPGCSVLRRHPLPRLRPHLHLSRRRQLPRCPRRRLGTGAGLGAPTGGIRCAPPHSPRRSCDWRACGAAESRDRSGGAERCECGLLCWWTRRPVLITNQLLSMLPSMLTLNLNNSRKGRYWWQKTIAATVSAY